MLEIGAKPVSLGGPARAWKQAPPIISNRLILTPTPGRIEARETTSPHREVWSYDAPWPTSLAGETARLLAGDSVLLAAIPRNVGVELLRLDTDAGKLLWLLTPAQSPSAAALDSLCIGDTCFYYVDAGTLYAYALNDGAQRWSARVGAGTRLRYSKHALAVFPIEARDTDFSIAFLDPWDGTLLQRLKIPGAHGSGSVAWHSHGLAVAVGGKIHGFRTLAVNNP